ncbi:MAG: hypothetical protein RMK43_12875 [Cyclobacteriaceae bacterium]|nr:hypothetical protein [Cyclobacteriaceae bacterium]
MSYLNDGYLESLHKADITLEPTLSGLRPVRRETPQPTTHTPPQQIDNPQFVYLPGGIRMPKETFYVLLVAVFLIVFYFIARKRPKE